MKIDWLNFMIVGAQRSGTTSLYMYLKNHPDIFLPRIKEPAYFVFNDPQLYERYKSYLGNSQIVHNPEAYSDLYAGRNRGQLCGDSSPEYLYFGNNVIKRMQEQAPSWTETKILIILREPISRCYSHYSLISNNSLDSLGFLEALKAEEKRMEDGMYPMRYGYKRIGLYTQQIQRYLDAFKHVKIIFFDDLVSNTQEVLDEVCDFLGVKNFNPEIEAHNASGKPRNKILQPLYKLALGPDNPAKRLIRKIFPDDIRVLVRNKCIRLLSSKDKSIPHETREYLRDYYRPELRRLEDTLANQGLKMPYAWR